MFYTRPLITSVEIRAAIAKSGWTKGSVWLASTVIATLTAGCAASPWDFPVPVMVGNLQGTSMTGFMATDSEAEVRRRLVKRMKCPGALEFVSLATERADTRIGTKILHYKAVMLCRAADGSSMPAAINANDS